MLLRRAETVVSEPPNREEVVKHIKKALTANVYKTWTFEIPQKKEKVKNSSKDRATARTFPVPLYLRSIRTAAESVQIP